MPIRTSSRCTPATCSAASPSSVTGVPHGMQPAEVGHDVAVLSKDSVPGTNPVAKISRDRRSTTHSPARDPLAHAPRRTRARRRQVDRAGPGQVHRGHLRVVGGVGVEAGDQLGDETVLVLAEGRVRALLLGDRGRVAGGRGGAAEAAESVRRQHRGRRPGNRSASRRAECHWSRVSRSVRSAPTRSVRPTLPNSSEPPVKTAVSSPTVGHGPGEVVRRVAGVATASQDIAPLANRVAVRSGLPAYATSTPAGTTYVAPCSPGQLEPAADVVVVDVRLETCVTGGRRPARSTRSMSRCGSTTTTTVTGADDVRTVAEVGVSRMRTSIAGTALSAPPGSRRAPSSAVPPSTLTASMSNSARYSAASRCGCRTGRPGRAGGRSELTDQAGTVCERAEPAPGT